jgi:hypothetical protein
LVLRGGTAVVLRDDGGHGHDYSPDHARVHVLCAFPLNDVSELLLIAVMNKNGSVLVEAAVIDPSLLLLAINPSSTRARHA